MEHELRNNLIAAAEELNALCGISEQSIGQMAIKDNTFFPRIRGEGKPRPAGFTIKTYDRVMGWMEDRKSAALLELKGSSSISNVDTSQPKGESA